MPFDFAKAKAAARRTVHVTLGVQAFYEDTSLNEPVKIRARWHNKIDRMGDLDNQMYAEVIQGLDRIVFEAAEARAIPVKRGGSVVFLPFGAGIGVGLGAPLGGEDVGPLAFILNVREPNNGPFEEIWNVTRKESVIASGTPA